MVNSRPMPLNIHGNVSCNFRRSISLDFGLDSSHSKRYRYFYAKGQLHILIVQCTYMYSRMSSFLIEVLLRGESLMFQTNKFLTINAAASKHLPATKDIHLCPLLMQHKAFICIIL